jgi:ABC-type hemin transport system substrate-binding protein
LGLFGSLEARQEFEKKTKKKMNRMRKKKKKKKMKIHIYMFLLKEQGEETEHGILRT